MSHSGASSKTRRAPISTGQNAPPTKGARNTTTQKYANKPLPPIPDATPRRISRKPVQSSTDTPPFWQQDLYTKPLPPQPLSPGRSSQRTTASSPAAGHRSSQKAQKIIGCDVDIHEDCRGSRSDAGFSTDYASEYSLTNSERCSRDCRPIQFGWRMTPSIQGHQVPMPAEEAPKRQVSFEASQFQNRHGSFSDQKASWDYHRFASALGASDSSAVPRTAQPRASVGSASRPLSPYPKRPAPPLPPHDSVSIDPFLQPHIDDTQKRPPVGERLTSAFDSDTDSDEEGVMASFKRGIAGMRPISSSSGKQKRQSEVSQSSLSIFTPLKQRRSLKAAEKAERKEREQKEAKARWKAQLKQEIQVKGDGRRCF